MKILQIVYHFPPMGGAGVQRGLKFARHLPQHGVQPVVLAGDDPHYLQDDSLLADLPPGLEVHRVRHSPWLARLAARRRGAAAVAPTPVAPPTVATAAPKTWLRDAVLRGVHSLQWPDDAAGWARRALPVALDLVRRHAASGAPIEAVFSSAPPASAHALAERIVRATGLPWVADHRDLWTDNPAYDAPAWRALLDRRLELRWLRAADAVVTVTPSWRDRLAAQRPGGSSTAFIPNGYDEDDFAGLVAPAAAPRRFTLVHTGTFYGPRSPAPLLDGVARYLESAAPGGSPPRLGLRLVGPMGGRFADTVAAFERRHPGVLETVDYRPHREALTELMGADALVLVVGGGRGDAVRGWLPGKIFEYLRAGKPVLTLGDPAGDAAALMLRHARGPVVDPLDTGAIARAIGTLVQGGPAVFDAGAHAPVNAYERRALAGQLAAVLRDAVARAGRPQGHGDGP